MFKKTAQLARDVFPNDDYNNDGSDNCDYNDQKVSHHMILMSRYKGQLHGGKKGQQIRAGVFPPFRAMPERNHFFSL